jgi:potassium-transporting ATPase KdpC subunit
MMKQIRTAIIAILILKVVLGLFYPLFVSLIGRSLFPGHAEGGLLKNADGQIIGSKFIGQNFSSPVYFHPRPSAAGEHGYDAMDSRGSNLGPTSKKLMDLLQERILAYRLENDLSTTRPLPADAVTASGSGLDPHISLDNAILQAPRVARARGVALMAIHEQIRKSTSNPYMGLFGEKRVNVLMLNIRLDQAFARSIAERKSPDIH